MNLFSEMQCANCGAAIEPASIQGNIATCGYCGMSFRAPGSLTPQPQMGDLLLGADFRDPTAPGWILSTPENLEFRPGSPAELWATSPASDLIHPVVRTPGPFEDVDASITIRFIEGGREFVSAGFELRSWDTGDYVARISAQGTFSLGWHQANTWGGELIGWTSHPALRVNPGDPNRLRVVARGEQLRIYLNGVLAASLRDGRFGHGRVRVVIAPGSQLRAVVAFSDLQLRDVVPG
jgi:hypothetical protein